LIPIEAVSCLFIETDKGRRGYERSKLRVWRREVKEKYEKMEGGRGRRE
jgi:hypothetical protein